MPVRLLVALAVLLTVGVSSAAAQTVTSLAIYDVDQTLPPNVVIDDEGDGSESSRFVFTTQDANRTYCAVDSGSWVRCSSGYTVSVVQGTHVAKVRPQRNGKVGPISQVTFEVCPPVGCNPPPPPDPQCSDGQDNDGDTLVDLNDPGCVDAADNDETDPPPPPPDPQCSDGDDNDGDLLIDLADPGCVDAQDNDETDPVPPPPSTHPYIGPYIQGTATATVDANSGAFIQHWLEYAFGNGPNFSKDSWGVALAEATDADPFFTFQTTNQSSAGCPRTAATRTTRIQDMDPNTAGIQIRAKVGARATPVANDGHLSIWDRSANVIHDFYDASFCGNLLQAQGGMTSTPGTNGFPGGAGFWGPNAANMPLRAGLVTPEDLADGHIDHALVFSNPFVGLGAPRFPAHANAPTCDRSPHFHCDNHIVEGTWLRLDPTVDVAQLDLLPWQKAIARAIQEYGMFLRDNGGSLAVYGATLYAENGRSESEWAAVGVPPGAPSFSVAFPWARMQVLNAPTP